MTTNEFRLLRYKGPDATNDVDADDPDFFALQLSPNAGYLEFGGTATDGNYVSTFTPVNGSAAVSVTTTRTGGTPSANSDLATQHAADINAAIAADPSKVGIAAFIRSASSSGALVTFVAADRRAAGDFVVSTSAPSPGTLTQIDSGGSTATGSRFPSARGIPYNRGANRHGRAKVEVVVLAIDSSGDVLVPGTCTYSIEFLEVVHRKNASGNELSDAVLTRGTDTTVTPGAVHTLECNGADQLGVRLHTIANEPVGTDRFEILYRQVVA